jgi:hypothetical protein
MAAALSTVKTHVVITRTLSLFVALALFALLITRFQDPTDLARRAAGQITTPLHAREI